MADLTCSWAPANDALYRAYHDEEWGVPERDSRALWEKFQLDGFQAGLSWITVLRKRAAMRKEFDGFDPDKVARWNEKRIAKALKNPGIIRSPTKINATMGTLASIWTCGTKASSSRLRLGIRERQTHRYLSPELEESASEDRAVREDRQGHETAGFKFCGPVIVYACMQAVGMVNDHEVKCPDSGRCRSCIESETARGSDGISACVDNVYTCAKMEPWAPNPPLSSTCALRRRNVI